MVGLEALGEFVIVIQGRNRRKQKKQRENEEGEVNGTRGGGREE